MENNSPAVSSKKHAWKFFRYGGIDQVSLETGQDLLALKDLDPKLWAALSCPTKLIEFDARTLEMLDLDHDNRVKITEILDGVQWACSLLKNPDDLLHSRDSLPLSAINASHPEGEKLLASAKQILKTLGKESSEAISLEDLADTEKIFVATVFNGDGIVIPESASHENTRTFIREIADCSGSAIDRSGKVGISEEHLKEFWGACQAYSEWWKRAESNEKEIFCLGKETLAAAKVFELVKGKIDDFFTRCKIGSFDPRFFEIGQALEKEYAGLLKKTLSSQSAELRDLPLAVVAKAGNLSLVDQMNPGWLEDMKDFLAQVVKPLVGNTQVLSLEQWSDIKCRFAPFEAWQAQKAGVEVEKLGLDRIREILGSGLNTEVLSLIERDRALEGEFNAITSVEKLVRLYRNLFSLLNNFVAFRDFYSGKTKAIFQAGTLFMDGRSCDLCVRVEDVTKHSAMASLCNTFLVYCDCVRQGTTDKMTIAAAFTAGDSDQLMVGRNGIFVDRKNKYWDASITKIIDHPISIQQAFWSPYKRLGRLIHEQIEKFAASKDKSVTESFTTGISETENRLAAGTPPPAQPFDVAKFAGIFAAIGLAIGAIGTAVASLVSGFLSLSWWQMPLAVGGIILAISGPAMLLAALRLRQRNLGPILDANGWAVNTRAQINLAFGATLTRVAHIPEGSVCSSEDPFAEKQSPWKWYASLFIALLLLVGLLSQPEIRGQILGAVKHALVQVKPQDNPIASGTASVASATTASEAIPPKSE